MVMVADKWGIVTIWVSFYKLPAQDYIALFFIYLVNLLTRPKVVVEIISE